MAVRMSVLLTNKVETKGGKLSSRRPH